MLFFLNSFILLLRNIATRSGLSAFMILEMTATPSAPLSKTLPALSSFIPIFSIDSNNALYPFSDSFIKNSSNLEVILHLSCKGRNRTQIKSRLESYYRKGLTNLLVVTGDYPKDSKPVFDLDSVQVLDLIACLEQKNCGLNNKTISLFAGAVCSPLHPLQELQRQKLDLKIQAGARFIVTQVGYDLVRLVQDVENLDFAIDGVMGRNPQPK